MCKCINLSLVCLVKWLSGSCLLEKQLKCLVSKNTDNKNITLIRKHFLPLISDICRQAAAGFHSLLKSLKSFKSVRKMCDKSVILGTVLTSMFSEWKERKQTAVLCVAACGRGVERMTFERVFVCEGFWKVESRKQMLNSRTVWSHLEHHSRFTGVWLSQSNKDPLIFDEWIEK